MTETDSDTTTTDGPSIDGASDAEMLAALRAAREAEPSGETEGDGEAEGESTAGEAAAPPGEAETTSPPAAASEPAEEETELGRLRKERAKLEREQKAREAMKAQLRAELEAELKGSLPKRDDLLAEARREWLARFKTDPVAAFRDADVDGAQAVARLADAASPEGKLHAKIAELEAALENRHEPLAKRLEQIEAERKREREQYEAMLRAQEERALVTQVETEAAKEPLVRAFFRDDSALVRRGREIAQEYCEATQKPTCPWSVIVSELKAEAKREAPKEIARLQERIAQLSKLVQGSAPAAVQATQPAETRGAAPGQRTLGAKSASERRATPKPASDMTDEERDAAALAAAREAMGQIKRGTRTVLK